ncbi:hypothetical protein KM043_004071 [Ampulex compressa]|nr:hypothetical protein KM043_004071 [Ampulex compressa]
MAPAASRDYSGSEKDFVSVPAGSRAATEPSARRFVPGEMGTFSPSFQASSSPDSRRARGPSSGKRESQAGNWRGDWRAAAIREASRGIFREFGGSPRGSPSAVSWLDGRKGRGARPRGGRRGASEEERGRAAGDNKEAGAARERRRGVAGGRR